MSLAPSPTSPQRLSRWSKETLKRRAGGGAWSSCSYSIHIFHPCQHQKSTVTTYRATIYMEVIQIKHKIGHLFGSLQKFKDWFKCSWSLQLLTNEPRPSHLQGVAELQDLAAFHWINCNLLFKAADSNCKMPKCKNKSMLGGSSFFPFFLS